MQTTVEPAPTAWGQSQRAVAVPDAGRGELASAAPAGRLARALGRLRQSLWLPVALRALGILLLLGVLALIGALSMTRRMPGVELLGQSAELGAAWLAPVRSAHEAAASGSAAHEAHDEPEKGALAQGRCDKPEKPPSAGVTKDGKVILNTADADDFTRLPGVGRRRAEEIVALRTRLKRFRKVTDLLRVRGIGPRSLKRLMPLVVLDPPAEPEPAAP
jgi:competence protein ComEA